MMISSLMKASLLWLAVKIYGCIVVGMGVWPSRPCTEVGVAIGQGLTGSIMGTTSFSDY